MVLCLTKHMVAVADTGMFGRESRLYHSLVWC